MTPTTIKLSCLKPIELKLTDTQLERMREDLETVREFKREFLKVHKHKGFD